jgi:hypothetical protein
MPLLPLLGVLTGLAGAAERDPTAARGLFLAGGMTDPAGSISFGSTSLAMPFIGLASLRVTPVERVEVFAQAAWVAIPEVATSTLWLAGVRAQAYRGELAAVSVEGISGVSKSDPDFVDSSSRESRMMGGGIGASACLDGARCRVVADVGVRFLAEHGAHKEFGEMTENGSLGLASAGLVAGDRWRGVLGVQAIAEDLEDPLFAVYAGGRYASHSAAVDLGVTCSADGVPLPILAFSLRTR